MVGTILSTSYSRELYENSVKMTTKAALYRHAWKHALICKDFTSFISNNDKNKVKCSEPGSPTSTVTWAERVLVAKKSNCQLHLYQNCIGNSSALQNAAEFEELLLQQYEDRKYPTNTNNLHILRSWTRYCRLRLLKIFSWSSWCVN